MKPADVVQLVPLAAEAHVVLPVVVPFGSPVKPALVHRQVVEQFEALPPLPPLVPFGRAEVGQAGDAPAAAPGVPSSQSS